jgi:hypothetical protein
MKRIIILPLLSALYCFAEETTSLDVIVYNLPNPKSIRFTPPAPPKEIPQLDVKGATSARFPTHRITILRGEASLLPDLPIPIPRTEVQTVSVAEVSDNDAEPVIHASLSVSANRGNPSWVVVFNPHTQTRHTAWCGWDMTLLVPVSQISVSGKLHEISFSTNPLALTDLPTDLARPRVQAGSILILDGDGFTEGILIALRQVLATNQRQLLAIRAAQEQYAKDAEAWHIANPPLPQNHTFWIRPHRGSRYLDEKGGDQ